MTRTEDRHDLACYERWNSTETHSRYSESCSPRRVKRSLYLACSTATGLASSPLIDPIVPEGVKKYCFRNSLRLATENPSLEYVEGVVIPATVERSAQRHAWCVDRGGRVIDSTPIWADPRRPLPNAMIGIALPPERARPYVECEEPTRGALDALSERLVVVTDALGLERID